MKIQSPKCFICNSNVANDIVALNRKLIERNVEKFFCLFCLADYLEVTPDELMDKMQEFKEQGCNLFR